MINMTFVDGGDLLPESNSNVNTMIMRHFKEIYLQFSFFPLKFYNKNITNWGA